MKKIVVQVGSRSTTSSGMPVDHMRPVAFEGENLGSRTTYHGSTSGGDDRGWTETLYKTADGRYVVFIEDWTRWQGETSTYKLVEASTEDLGLDGHFEDLARECGLPVRPLTLDEALDIAEDVLDEEMPW